MKRIMLVSLFALCIAAAAAAAGPAVQSAETSGGAVLSAQEVADLQFMREEEKLARDVYQVLFDKWGLRVFSNIGASEQRHTDAVKHLIYKYGISDPAAATAPGVFVNEELQTLYDQLVAQGLTSKRAALEVGVLIEETDIDDLKEARGHTARADILQVYGNLLDASYNHLAAFTR